MSRLIAIALFVLSSTAHAQIIFGNKVAVLQDGRAVGAIWVGRDAARCSPTEHWFLFEDYRDPGADGGGFTIEPDTTADESLDTFLRTMWSEHPDGRYVQVDIEESSEACR